MSVTKAPKSVVKMPLSDEQAIYFVGDWSFDESDRNPDYIKEAIETWQAWAAYVGVDLG